MFDLGMQELVVIFIVALIVFGPKRLPELGRTLGKGINELKGALSGIKEQVDEEVKDVRGQVEEQVKDLKPESLIDKSHFDFQGEQRRDDKIDEESPGGDKEAPEGDEEKEVNG